MSQSVKQKLYLFGVYTLLFAVGLGFYLGKSPVPLYFTTLAMWAVSMTAALKHYRECLVYAAFLICFFLFLLGMPLVNFCTDSSFLESWAEYYSISASYMLPASMVILVALYSLAIGTLLAGLPTRSSEVQRPERHFCANTYVMKCAGIVYWGTLPFVYACEIEKLLFIRRNTYSAFYASFSSQLPYPIYVLSTLCFYALLLYLAAKPRKEWAYAAMGAYLVSRIPMLIGGGRSDFVSVLGLCILYICFRQAENLDIRRISLRAKLVSICAATVGILGLGVLSSLRDGRQVDSANPFAIFLSFLREQGVTYTWLCCGMEHMDELRETRVISYTLGPFLDYILHNSIAQKLFGAVSLGTGSNTVIAATQGSILANHLSYLYFDEETFLAGYGTGDCYLLDLFADGGTLLVVLFHIPFGYFLCQAFSRARKNQFFLYLLLGMFPGILLMPRAYAVSPIAFLWRLPFWLVTVGCFAGSWVWRKLVERKRRKG